jgi:hypothetical protein
MKIIRPFNYLLGVLLLGALIFTGCSDDDDTAPELNIEAITATGTDLETGEEVTVDLNGVSSATNVPPNAVFTVTFDREVDASSVSASAVSIAVDGSTVAATVSASGSEVTITPDEDLSRGEGYEIEISSSVVAADGGVVAGSATRTFQTAGRAEVVAPQEANMTFYMNFDGELTDATGNYSVGFNEITGYETDRFGFNASSAHFNGNGDIIDIANSEALLSESITISFWMKVDAADTNKVNHNFGIMGSAAERGFLIEMGGPADGSWIKPTTSHLNADDAYGTAWSDAINGGGATNDVVTTAFEGDVSALFDDKWVQFVLTYDASSSVKTIYMDGTVVREENFTNQDPTLLALSYNEGGVEETINKNFALGFYGSSENAATGWADYNSVGAEHPRSFSGLMDDVRIWNVALSGQEVATLYDDERP